MGSRHYRVKGILYYSKNYWLDWEKKRHQKNTVVAKTMFTQKYEDTVFDLPAADDIAFYMNKDDIVFISQKKDGGWTIFVVCGKEGEENESSTSLLAMSSIYKKPQQEGVIVEMPKPGGEEGKV